jgi:hypothetical protein
MIAASEDLPRKTSPIASDPWKTRAGGAGFQHFKSSCRPHSGDEEARGDNRMHSMLTLLLLSSIFIAGFLVGYVACAWRRRSQFATLEPRISMFGHPRRAF